jgi:hypothetical protein
MLSMKARAMPASRKNLISRSLRVPECVSPSDAAFGHKPRFVPKPISIVPDPLASLGGSVVMPAPAIRSRKRETSLSTGFYFGDYESAALTS